MLTNSWALLAIAGVYLSLLFVIAWVGDARAQRKGPPARRPLVYALGLTVYCTSWSIYGTAQQTAEAGWPFPPTFLGTIVLFVLFAGVLHKLVRVAKANNISSLADFISSRYGKSGRLATLATVMAVLCSTPYIALQLKAVSESLAVVAGGGASFDEGRLFPTSALLVSALMAGFAILFGARRAVSTEQNHGLMLAIAIAAPDFLRRVYGAA